MKKQFLQLALLFFSCFIVFDHAQAAVMTFQRGDARGIFSETDDGTLDTSSSSNPQSSVLRVGRKDSSLQRFALKFPNFFGTDVNQIPVGAKINSASIKLRETSDPYYNTVIGATVDGFKILESWEEGVTSGYYGYPGWYFRLTGSIPWTNVGLGTPQSSEAASLTTNAIGRSYETTFSFDVTTEIQKQVSYISSNDGFVFHLQDEATLDTCKEFHSSEAVSLANRPVLEINYDLPDAGDTSAPVISGALPAGILASHTTEAQISFLTNENSVCKYSLNPDVNYVDMTGLFEVTGNASHSQNITGLIDGGTYDYYVRCLDYNSNFNSVDFHVAFSVAADSTPPAQIQNFSVSNCLQHSCDLSWSAVGDDASNGTAAQYDIRYSNSSITELNWSNATQVTNEINPKLAGQNENMTVNGLEAGSAYYFAIKTKDLAQNWSVISNVTNGSTQAPSAPASVINAWTIDSNMKIRPQDAQGIGSAFNIEGAKNETVSMQFAITADVEQLNNVDVSVDLPGFTSIIYREDFMHVVTPSHMLGDTGEWPDILIPKVDDYFGETRNAFPATINNISKAYPLIAALPAHSYGPWRDGKWMSNVVPASGYVWPYDGTQLGGGNSNVYNQGTGKVSTSGIYLGSQKSRYIVVIENGGAIGTATFKWSADNGVTFQNGVPTSASIIDLGAGVKISFSGAGQSTDFVANDEWLFYVSPSRNQPIWIDVEIPKNAVAGDFTGTVNVSANGRDALSIPISLKVWNFSIPDTSSLKNFFGKDSELTSGHGLAYTDPLAKVYVAAGLKHKISLGDSLSGASGGGNTIVCNSYDEANGILSMNYVSFDNVMAPFLNGTGTSFAPAGITFSGKLTTFTEPAIVKAGCTVADNIKFTELARIDFINHLRVNGWLDQFHVYLGDEPYALAAWENINTKGSQWRAAAPDVSMFVTTTLENAEANNATNFIDVYVPNSTTEIALGDVETDSWSYPRANFNSFINLASTPKKDVWWYSACMESGSCSDVGGSYYINWANYGIDSTAIQNIMRLWMTRYYDYHGELYYAVNYNWDHYSAYNFIDPWDTSYYFSDNGDGQLFYPGRPDKIGGTKDIPVESLRLKLIRNGFQNYEYMHLLDGVGEQVFVQNKLNTIITGAQSFTSNPAALAQVRIDLANKIIATIINDPVAPQSPSGLMVQ